MEGFDFNRVYVIESLDDSEELLTGTALYEDLLRYQHLKNDIFSAKLISCTTKEELFNSLNLIKTECQSDGIYPIIHFEIHGEENLKGLITASGELVTWMELYTFISEINIAVKNNLFLTLAVCHGAHIMGLSDITNPAPFWGFIGSFETIEEYDLMLRYNEFYTELFNSMDITKSLLALYNANPNSFANYTFINSETLFQDLYKQYLKKSFSPAGKKVRWKNALAESNIVLVTRPERRKFKKDFDREIIATKKHYFETHKNTFFMIDRYPENSKRFLSNWSPV